jgi:hypothetical protein
MSCNLHVYVGAAVRIDSAPEDAREILDDNERLWQPCDGNEKRLPYLLPNVECDCGHTYDRYGEARTVREITDIAIVEAVARLYKTFREDLLALSDAGFTITVVYVALDYWY